MRHAADRYPVVRHVTDRFHIGRYFIDRYYVWCKDWINAALEWLKCLKYMDESVWILSSHYITISKTLLYDTCLSASYAVWWTVMIIIMWYLFILFQFFLKGTRKVYWASRRIGSLVQTIWTKALHVCRVLPEQTCLRIHCVRIHWHLFWGL
jgi:hypothetical protein